MLILGFNPDHMRIVVRQDLNLKILHAVLVVYLDGQPLILDNQIKQVVHASRLRHYKPIYSINQKIDDCTAVDVGLLLRPRYLI